MKAKFLKKNFAFISDFFVSGRTFPLNGYQFSVTAIAQCMEITYTVRSLWITDIGNSTFCSSSPFQSMLQTWNIVRTAVGILPHWPELG